MQKVTVFTAATAVTAATAAGATAAAAATVTMPFWLPVVGATSLVVGAVLVVKTQAFADNAVEEAQPPHGTVLGHGSFGRVTLHKEGAACVALKSIPHCLLQSRSMEKALHIEREALGLCRASRLLSNILGTSTTKLKRCWVCRVWWASWC